MEDQEGSEDGDEERKSLNTAEDSDEVDFNEKIKFTERVRLLDNDGLTKLVCKVRELCREALEDVDEEKLHIQVDRINRGTFTKLSALVDECTSSATKATATSKRARR